jgi:hypothetical protein
MTSGRGINPLRVTESFIVSSKVGTWVLHIPQPSVRLPMEASRPHSGHSRWAADFLKADVSLNPAVRLQCGKIRLGRS